MDPLLLSRLQFAWVIAFHILLPAFTVGLASYIALLEGLHLFTRRQVYLRISKFWIRIFAVSFGMGVVSGIVMPFQFGTNWSRFAEITGNVTGPLMAYEALMAFFLEASFLGVLLFGRDRVPPWAHFIAALMVAFGTLLSSFWILAVNSWMQTPAGAEMRDGVFHVVDWLAVIFTPSLPYRLAHTVNAFFISTGLVVVAVSALYAWQQRFIEESRTMMRTTLSLLSVLVPLQVLIGDLHGLNTLQHQPLKVAAMEGNWEPMRGMPLTLFALPDQAAERNHFEIGVPKLGSLILTHSLDGEVPGLKQWPASDRPPVAIVFFAFRLMVGLGVLMFALVAWSWWLRWRGRLHDSRAFQIACMAMLPAGFVSIIAGWVTTEVGRQPWVVYGLVRTGEALTPSLSGGDVLISLLVYMVVYTLVFGTGALILWRMIQRGPDVPAPQPRTEKRPARPLSALDKLDEGAPHDA